MAKPRMFVVAFLSFLMLVMAFPRVASATNQEDTRPCFEVGTTYEPLDMKGYPVGNQAGSATECQTLCQQKQECYHFSFDMDAHLCHLQDMFAAQMITRYGFTAGPRFCLEDMTTALQKTMTRLETRGAGMHTYVELPFRCMEMASLYVPVLKGPISFSKLEKPQMDDKSALLACQHLCDTTVGCYHFTMMFPERACSMSGADAVVHHPVFDHVSGPPSCDHDPTAAPAEATTPPSAITPPSVAAPVATTVPTETPAASVTGIVPGTAPGAAQAAEGGCPDCLVEDCQNLGHKANGKPQEGTCTEECTANTYCSMGMICCSNGCGHTCMLPQAPRASGSVEPTKTSAAATSSSMPSWVGWTVGILFTCLIGLSICGCIFGKGPKNKDEKKPKKKKGQTRGVEVENGSRNLVAPERRPLVNNEANQAAQSGVGAELVNSVPQKDSQRRPSIEKASGRRESNEDIPFNTSTLQSRPNRQESTSSAGPSAEGMPMVMTAVPVTTVLPMSPHMMQGNQMQGHPMAMLVPPPPPGSMMVPQSPQGLPQAS